MHGRGFHLPAAAIRPSIPARCPASRRQPSPSSGRTTAETLPYCLTTSAASTSISRDWSTCQGAGVRPASTEPADQPRHHGGQCSGGQHQPRKPASPWHHPGKGRRLGGAGRGLSRSGAIWQGLGGSPALRPSLRLSRVLWPFAVIPAWARFRFPFGIFPGDHLGSISRYASAGALPVARGIRQEKGGDFPALHCNTL